MNINKILSNITFDDFLSLIDKYTNCLFDDKSVQVRLFQKDTDVTYEKFRHKLFIYFSAMLYKREKYSHFLLTTDTIFEKLYNKEILTEDILNKYKHLFVKITPAFNTYLLYSLTDDDKEFINFYSSILLQDFYKFNEKLVSKDKQFFLGYITYVSISSTEYFDLFIQIYPELKESNPVDTEFFTKFWHKIIWYNPQCISVNFLYKYYQIIPNIALQVLTTKPIFFKLSEQCRQKIKEKLNNSL